MDRGVMFLTPGYNETDNKHKQHTLRHLPTCAVGLRPLTQPPTSSAVPAESYGVPENPDVIAPGMAHWRTMYPGVKVRPSCRHKQFYHTHSIHTSGHPLTCSVPTLTTTTFSARTTTRVEPEGVCVGHPRPFRGLATRRSTRRTRAH